MARKESKREKAEREFAFLREPETLEKLCSFIADRGTLAEWCKSADLRYRPVYEWLHDVDVPERLEKYTRALEARHSSLSDLVVSGLRDIVDADFRTLYDKNGKLLAPHKLPDRLARVVASVKEDDKGGIDVKLESRKGGHELLGRALGLYRDRIEHEGKLTLEDLVGGSHQGGTGGMTPGRDASDSCPGPRSSSKT
jgi:hypothetical protein